MRRRLRGGHVRRLRRPVRLRSGQVRRQVRRRLRSGQVRRLRRLGDRLRRLRGHRLRRRLLAVDVGWLGMGLLLTV